MLNHPYLTTSTNTSMKETRSCRLRSLDSTRSTTRITRLFQYQVVRAREPASFWPGKRDSRSHSTKSLSENVIVAEIIYGYRMLEVLSFWDTGSGLNYLQQN